MAHNVKNVKEIPDLYYSKAGFFSFLKQYGFLSPVVCEVLPAKIVIVDLGIDKLVMVMI